MSATDSAARELLSSSASELARRIAARDLSPVEIADACLDRIAELNPRLNAFLTVEPEQVRDQAIAAERVVASGEATGALHGVPIAVKDLEDTAGLRTTYGAEAYATNIPARDSILVERLRLAGAIVLGKTNTPAFGLLGETKNALGDSARNPWNRERCTGGSSGGSAVAVATSMAPLATGTDSAGSITCPSSMCGVFGIKPSHGRVPMQPDAGDSLTFNDGGPLARTVADAALMLSVVAGHDPRDPVSLRDRAPDYVAALDGSFEPARVAYSADLGHFAVDAEVARITEAGARVFEEVGCTVEAATPAVEDPWRSYAPIYLADAQAGLAEFLAEHGHELYPETHEELAGSESISGADVARAWHGLHVFRAAMADFFETYDLLVTPATAVTAFAVESPPTEIGGRRVDPGWMTFMPFSIPWNMTGQPTASVPCGFDDDGLPVGLMLIGRHGREDQVFRAAAAFERARPWPMPAL